ncbi:hypothetical protein AWT69_004106 [Pseudomonas putida]|nr:hypothetical protein AWT69_004106 [Pseudomonas putida]
MSLHCSAERPFRARGGRPPLANLLRPQAWRQPAAASRELLKLLTISQSASKHLQRCRTCPA